MANKYYNGTTHTFYSDFGDSVYIRAKQGQNLIIEGYEPAIPDRLEVKAMSDALGLNQLSEEQVLDQETSGVYESEGSSVSIMNSDLNPVRLACGAPKVNSGGSTNGGALTYSSTAGGLFSGPAAYRTNTFCDDYTGQYTAIDPLGEWLAFSLNNSPVSSPPLVNLYRWNGSSYSYNRNFMNFEKPRIYGNYIVLSNLSSGLAVYFFNGSTWSLQQTISTVSGISMFDIRQDRIHFLDDQNHLVVYSRSGTVWSQISDTPLNFPMDSVINSIGFSDSGLVLAVVRDSAYIDIYDSLELTTTLSSSFIGGTAVTPNGNFIFHFDGSEITIITKVAGVWTAAANKTSCPFVDNIACNNTRLVAGRSVVDTYGRISVFHISEYTNELVIADEVYADEQYDLVVKSNYRNVDIIGTDVNITNQNNGATYINGSLDILGNLDVGGALTFSQVNVGFGSAGTPSINFGDDLDTGIYSSGDGNVDFSLNGVNKMNLGSAGLTVPKLVSSGPFFKLNMYNQAQVQPFSNAVNNAVEFGTVVLEENTGIARSSITYSGAPNAGTRFTNSSGQTLRLMVCWSVTCTGGTSARSDFSILSNAYLNTSLSRVTHNVASGGYSVSSSCMFVLTAGQYFELTMICVPGMNISTSASNSSMMQIYSLA